MKYKTGKKGIELIKSFEGCRLAAYKCPAGVLTIGYGHTSGVKSGQKITQAQAETLLKTDLAKYENAVNECVTAMLNQNQFDALVSFAYNCGAGALKSSTLLKKLNAGDYSGAAAEFVKWNKASGKVLAGLTKRRTAERALFNTAEKSVSKKTVKVAEITSGYTTGTYIVKASKMNVRTGHGTNYPAKAMNQLTASAQKQGGYKKGVKFTALKIYQTATEAWAKTPSGWVCIQNAAGTYCKKQ